MRSFPHVANATRPENDGCTSVWKDFIRRNDVTPIFLGEKVKIFCISNGRAVQIQQQRLRVTFI